MNYKQKYLKYKKLCNNLNNVLFGGSLTLKETTQKSMIFNYDSSNREIIQIMFEQQNYSDDSSIMKHTPFDRFLNEPQENNFIYYENKAITISNTFFKNDVKILEELKDIALLLNENDYVLCVGYFKKYSYGELDDVQIGVSGKLEVSNMNNLELYFENAFREIAEETSIRSEGIHNIIDTRNIQRSDKGFDYSTLAIDISNGKRYQEFNCCFVNNVKSRDSNNRINILPIVKYDKLDSFMNNNQNLLIPEENYEKINGTYKIVDGNFVNRKGIHSLFLIKVKDIRQILDSLIDFNKR